MNLYKVSLSLSFFMSFFVFQAVAANNHLQLVLSKPELRQECVRFMDNVLRQAPALSFLDLADALQKKENPQSDLELYALLLDRIHEIKPRFFVYHQLEALRHQKKILGAQVQKLVGPLQVVDGYVEIGTPATYLKTISTFLKITGDTYVVHDQQRWADYLQAYSINPLNGFKPYDHFVAHKNHDPIQEQDIPSNSVDLVVCVVGLHHISVEKLDGFVASIHRILRPGGTFILRDHNADSDQMKSIISTAHTVYNLIATAESVAAEAQEYRNFQPLAFWITLLESHGFVAGSERLLQEGDPTLNTMLMFTKKPQNEEEELQKISHALKNRADCNRDLMQTYLTTSEWINVDISKEYGNFIEHTPFYEFPYMKSVALYWKVFAKSWQVAAQKAGNLKVLTSDYALMNAFIGLTMTVEYSTKALISAPIRWMYSGQEAEKITLLVQDRQHEIESISGVTVLEVFQNTHSKLVKVPRYKEFLKTMQAIEKTNIDIIEIAGQKEIQCRVRFAEQSTIAWENIVGCKKEYEWSLPTQPGIVYAAITVQVSELKGVMKQLPKAAIELIHIHDF